MFSRPLTWLGDVRARMQTAFGVSNDARVSIVRRMLEGHARSAASYWLQLSIALALATLGLVLNGPGVVIGAMLVSPLMNPIVELGMGLAVGSPLLAIRSLVRIFWSIAVVLAGAGLITAALPFHEVTAEVAARTSPTALDLMVAVFCALAAAYTTLRSGADGATAAAGTAIAIALVPPLCVVGFGIGTSDRAIAEGAFLLFTANLCAILLVAVLTFWVFGFNQVSARHLEEMRFEGAQPTSRLVRLVRVTFGSRYGTWVRLLIPLVLVATVWLPLSRALRTVTWEVHARKHIQRIIDDLPLARSAVRASVSVKHGVIHVALVVVGRPSAGRSLQAILTTRIAERTGASPLVEVVSVPDLETMEDVARTLAKSELAQRRPQPDLLGATADIAEALKRAWPVRAAGEIRRWRLDLTDREQPRLEVVHLGAPLGDAALIVLGAMIEDRVHAPVVVRDVAIPPEAITAAVEEGKEWLPKLAATLEWVRADSGLVACVTLPPPVATGRNVRRRGAELAPIRTAALSELAKLPEARAHWAPGDRWSVQIRTGPCEGVSPVP